MDDDSAVEIREAIHELQRELFTMLEASALLQAAAILSPVVGRNADEAVGMACILLEKMRGGR